jgi:hypothetical protein
MRFHGRVLRIDRTHGERSVGLAVSIDDYKFLRQNGDGDLADSG